MIKILLPLCLLCFAINATAQNTLSSKDSITTFYNSLTDILKTDYLYKDTVDWTATEQELHRRLESYTDFKSSLQEITVLFNAIKADHCTVIYENQRYKNSSGLNASELTDEWIKKYKTNPQFEVKVLDNQYAYILMPGIDLLDTKKSHQIAKPMYDEIAKIKNSKNIAGWIVDLRFNTGGNSTPMLLALYDLLGNNEVWGELDINQKRTERVRLTEGKYKSNAKKIAQIKPKGETLVNEKVAVLIGPATGSSGEITAMAFKGREHTVFIGQETYGATTANERRDLPFGAVMALTVGYDCDRNGIFYETIKTDLEITDQDNFDNLLVDGNVKAAIDFFKESN